MPTASAAPLPEIEWMFFEMSVPITGKLRSAESRMLCWRLGLPLSSNPSTLTNTSSRGNREKNP